MGIISLCFICRHRAEWRGARDCKGAQRMRKRSFLSHLYIKPIILPRQARDKHRESTQKQTLVSGGASARISFRWCISFVAFCFWRMRNQRDFAKTSWGRTRHDTNKSDVCSVYIYIYIYIYIFIYVCVYCRRRQSARSRSAWNGSSATAAVRCLQTTR